MASADPKGPVSPLDSTAAALNHTVKTPRFSLMKEREVESAETPKTPTLISPPSATRRAVAGSKRVRIRSGKLFGFGQTAPEESSE